MKTATLVKVIGILEKAVRPLRTPAVSEKKITGRDPFKILVATVISLRTKDRVTSQSSIRLFSKVSTPRSLAALPVKEIRKLIYPCGFYKTKAATLKRLAEVVDEKYGGKVPDNLEELLKLKGVGRKTANLVVTEGFGKSGICVDTHVHRIMNRFGFVKTANPLKTELVLRKKLPKKYWISINRILVTWGQNICLPVSPFCSRCLVRKYCPKTGVSVRR